MNYRGSPVDASSWSVRRKSVKGLIAQVAQSRDALAKLEVILQLKEVIGVVTEEERRMIEGMVKRLLNDSHPVVRLHAASMGICDSEFLLTDDCAEVRAAATLAVPEQSRDCIVAVTERIGDGSALVRKAAVSRLVRLPRSELALGDPQLNALLPILTTVGRDTDRRSVTRIITRVPCATLARTALVLGELVASLAKWPADRSFLIKRAFEFGCYNAVQLAVIAGATFAHPVDIRAPGFLVKVAAFAGAASAEPFYMSDELLFAIATIQPILDQVPRPVDLDAMAQVDLFGVTGDWAAYLADPGGPFQVMPCGNGLSTVERYRGLILTPEANTVATAHEPDTREFYFNLYGAIDPEPAEHCTMVVMESWEGTKRWEADVQDGDVYLRLRMEWPAEPGQFLLLRLYLAVCCRSADGAEDLRSVSDVREFWLKRPGVSEGSRA